MVQVLKNLGPIRMAAIGAIMLGIFGFFVYLLGHTSQGNMTLLYAQVDPMDGAKIVDKIEAQGIPVEIRGDGTQIYVPSDKIARLRMELAHEGLPSGGSVGYEIFDRNDLLNSTGTMVDINRLRALEGEISKSIKSIHGVEQARTHLVIPKRELFTRDKMDPSASLVLKMKGAQRLTPNQVQAIQHLVASAVPGLSVDHIAIVDDKGTLLAKNRDGDDVTQGLLTQMEARTGYEAKTAKTIENLLEKTVGVGKVRVEVSADLDFDQITINAEQYDPDGQVVRSSANSKDDSSSTEGGAQNVSVQNALPQNNAQGGASGSTGNTSKHNDENIQYEISRTVKTQNKGVGAVNRLSIAVLVDGTYAKDANGKSTYTPRTKEELDQLKLLVKTASGIKTDRGDVLEVVNMKFAETGEESADPLAKPEQTWLPKMDLTRIIELAVLAVVGILILLMIVRPLLLRMVEFSGVAEGDAEAAAMLAVAQGQPQNAFMALPAGSLPPAPLPENEQYSPDSSDDMLINLENVEGRVKASSVKKIAEIIDKHPEEAVTILRNWMYEEPWKQEKIT